MTLLNIETSDDEAMMEIDLAELDVETSESTSDPNDGGDCVKTMRWRIKRLEMDHNGVGAAATVKTSPRWTSSLWGRKTALWTGTARASQSPLCTQGTRLVPNGPSQWSSTIPRVRDHRSNASVRLTNTETGPAQKLFRLVGHQSGQTNDFLEDRKL